MKRPNKATSSYLHKGGPSYFHISGVIFVFSDLKNEPVNINLFNFQGRSTPMAQGMDIWIYLQDVCPHPYSWLCVSMPLAIPCSG